jgi:glyoxylase-like metal-dependent hydrolase (beta-lactamase superfamily II)
MNGIPIKPVVAAFFDKRTCSVQYVVSCPDTRRCAVIDPVLDFDPKSGATATYSADAILEHMRSERLGLDWVLDTHPHADHFSAAGYLKDKMGARAATGEKVVEVQRLWKNLYNLPDSFRTDGSQWDKLFADGERFSIGNLTCEVMLSPGHTLASITYVMSDAAFVHDTLFMPDGYMPGGREPRWESTVAQQKADNIHLLKARTEAEFVLLREARDRTLAMPKLILAALQVNIAGGRLPEPESNGRRYLKTPLDALENVVWDE